MNTESVESDLRAQRVGGYESVRPEVQAVVPRTAQRILDVGCASGQLGAALKGRQGAEVVGIELGEDYARDAAQVLDQVFPGDVIAVLENPANDFGTFDAIICADVLEHLVEPWRALDHLTGMLRPGGTLVVSVPNVRHWQILRQVFVRGSWPRLPAGPFDGTHLRWFTERDARALLTDAGLTVTEVHPQLWNRWEHQIRPLLRLLRVEWLVHGQLVLVGVKR